VLTVVKRAMDLLLAAVGLLLLVLPMSAIALAIKLDSPGPVFFRQERVGRGGRPFRIHKFRTMAHRPAGDGLQLTVGDDQRITRVGRWLRARRFDELPQLIDVLKGDMSIVGPRPEVPRYVAHYTAEQRAKLLSVRPGITDPASLAFKDEARILAAAADPERAYLEEVLPRKLQHALAYAEHASAWTDVRLIARTLKVLITG
jgi:lipopolysaccharide/colanic/teichoic acid biosynthesis glycosyltransferase